MRLFKKNRITKTRRLLKNKKWLKERLHYLIEYSQSLNSFRRWECDSFFVGNTVASYNFKKYRRDNDRNDRRIDFIEKCIENLNQ